MNREKIEGVNDTRTDSRQYPERPVIGVGAVIVRADQVVIVKRRYEPLAGRWSLPGGTLELGETLEAGVMREMREETGLEVDVGPVIEVFDRIMLDEQQRIRYHFVLVDYLCWPVGGELCAGSDVAEAIFADPEGLDPYDLTEKARGVIERGIELARESLGDVRLVSGLPTRDAAWQLLTEWTLSESLRKHALAVEAAVRGYARKFDEDEESWASVALLHDLDYERYPTPTDHPFRGCEELQRRGYPEWVTRAILSHADYSGIARESLLEKTLYACDEMAGFVTAAALVRPSKSILDLEAPSVLKRMKDKAFARAVSRDDLRRGADELGLPLEEHVANVIHYMRESVDRLGLRGSL